MAAKNRGKKHILLLYHRTMDRLWGITILLGLVLFALWRFEVGFTRLWRPELKGLVYTAAGIVTAIGLFAFFARRLGYVRAFGDYVLIATPFFRFRTSYRRVRSIRTTEFYRIFELENLSWREENYIKPFLGETAVILSLKDFPLPPGVLRLFLPKYFMSPKGVEIVLLVRDWMSLSVELDSRFSEFRQRVKLKKRNRGFQRGMYR
jgi:hypothetical protein